MADFDKLLIKVVNESHDQAEWTHFSYVDGELFSRFLKEKGLGTGDMNDVLSRWAHEDFGVELAMSSKRDIEILKMIVKDFYKRAHPDLYIESSTDRQGWLRVWISRKMKEELGIYGKECF